MGIETQAILPGHLTVEKICGLLSANCKLTVAGARQMHRPDYYIVEFFDRNGTPQAVNVFLNSFAASDYQEVFKGDSTLVTMEFSPSNFEVVNALASVTGGYIQRTAEESWFRADVQVT
ncbi:hypothetical protein [Sandarakinorhabdus sp.]|uniref:hypothetical protein n=1 Tax=Sandarakinorhabdus sp. TaxID=1916663 RepID=UPI003F704A2D